MNKAPHPKPMPSSPAAQIARGTIRFLIERGNSCIGEFTFNTGRRADIIAIDRKGIITIVEVKSSQADFRSDVKWREYLTFCDLFYFAVANDFPSNVLPTDCGLMVADAYGASIVYAAKPNTLNSARRKSITLRFAQVSARRLIRFTDPDWVRG
ncbi:MAG: hypothetical protein CFH10_01839 [Alphaproteobacteria bacterium MarineAlpha4_Bin2]|nr:MAG: hypothetical protein CFH10_01839 [Alphaproteobacteria bacterium MarineAlpha4_Bin2]